MYGSSLSLKLAKSNLYNKKPGEQGIILKSRRIQIN